MTVTPASLWFQHLALVVAEMGPRRIAVWRQVYADQRGRSAAASAIIGRGERVQVPRSGWPPAGAAAIPGGFPAAGVAGKASCRRADRARDRPLGHQRCGCRCQHGVLSRARVSNWETGHRTTGSEQQRLDNLRRGRGVGRTDAAGIGHAASGVAGLPRPARRRGSALAAERHRRDARSFGRAHGRRCCVTPTAISTRSSRRIRGAST